MRDTVSGSSGTPALNPQQKGAWTMSIPKAPIHPLVTNMHSEEMPYGKKVRDYYHTYYTEAFLVWLAKYQTVCDPIDSYFRIPNLDIEVLIKEVKK